MHGLKYNLEWERKEPQSEVIARYQAALKAPRIPREFETRSRRIARSVAPWKQVMLGMALGFVVFPVLQWVLR